MYFVYMFTNWNSKVIYIGVSNNLKRRLFEHRNAAADSFTKRYNINKLVYFESCDDIKAAIEREKQLKGWRRQKKNNLVERMNPTWEDLSADWDN